MAAVSVTALGAGVMYVTTTRRTPAEVRFTLSVPESVGLDPRIALSPDGRSLVYVAPGAVRIDLLWVRHLDELEGKPLAGTEVHPRRSGRQTAGRSGSSRKAS